MAPGPAGPLSPPDETRTRTADLRPLLEAALIAAAVVAGLLALQGHLDLNLGGEGFLWYGAIRVAAGDVPLRDFHSYDPGRYYWAAAWLWALGSDSLWSLRVQAAIFQWLGLTAGLLALRRAVGGSARLIAPALLLGLWMFPFYRAFDTTIAMTGVLVALRLIEQPSGPRYFLAGVYAGLAAWFGRNHGLYLLLGFLALGVFLGRRLGAGIPWRGLARMGAGVVAGYAPMLAMLAVVPGLLRSFIDGLRPSFGASVGGPYARSVPWPWIGGEPPEGRASAFCLGLFFVALPVFCLLAALVLRRSREGAPRSLLLASIFVGVPYLHCAFSRADAAHLATAIQPLLIGVVALPFAARRDRGWAAAMTLALMLIASLLAVGPRHPLGQWARSPDRDKWAAVDARGSAIRVEPATRDLVAAFVRLKRERLRPGDWLLITPRWTILYPLLGLVSPVWEILPFFPASESEQARMIDELDRRPVEWAVTCEKRGEDRFRLTHPLVWRRLAAWEAVESPGLPPGCLLRRRPGS